MPEIFELFGIPLHDRSAPAESIRKARKCPFMNEICDGGGNRYQTEIPLTSTELLTHYFNSGITSVVPGVCSILTGRDIWVVCPRRLFANRYSGSGVPPLNYALQNYERELLINAGLPRGINLGFWSEVAIKYGADINYHFDYVAAPLLKMSLRDCLKRADLSPSQISDVLDDLVKLARMNGYFYEGQRNGAEVPTLLPDISNPYILEIMTASTSGSDTKKATDIRNAFRRAILYNDRVSPGINKRQVWGRMVTQLFAKTALASEWGGKTIWVVQDELLRSIELTTRLQTSAVTASSSHRISLAIMCYKPVPSGGKEMSFKTMIDGDAGVDFRGGSEFTDILLPKLAPPKIELLRAVLRRKIDAIINI